jgi:hypothetical protein
MKFPLSQLALVLGSGCLLAHLWPLLSPGTCAAWLRRFHRNTAVGVVLVLLGTAWFEWNLITTDISDFSEFRTPLLVGFVVLGIGCCFFVRDFLSIRGLAIVACLAADVVLDSQRWHPSPFKNVVTVWAYVWVVAGMWLAVAPWRARDWLAWCTAQESRLRALGLAGVAWGALVAVLGLTAYR